MSGGEFALPHPFKRENSVAHNRRQYGADELSTDMSFCEGIFQSFIHMKI